MIYIRNFNLWIILWIISQASAVSYNQPKFFPNASWNPNAITFADNSTIGQNPFDIFINTNNTIYVPNQQTGQIFIWFMENNTLTVNSGSNGSNPYSLFVTMSGDIYVDTLNSWVGGGVSRWTSNLTSGILVMRTCNKCWDIFVDITNVLYCSLDQRHQVIAKSWNDSTNAFSIVAGTGSADSASNTLNNPRGIFVDINFDLYVADCGNNRIQLFHFGKLTGITVVGNSSSNVTMTLNCPTAIIQDADRYLFIVDSGNNRIVRSGYNGFQCLAGCSGSSGSASNQLNSPSSLSFDNYGNIFIVDQGNNRIQKFLLSAYSNRSSFACMSNETVYGVWNTTAGGDSTISTSGSNVGNYYPTEIPQYACDNNINTAYNNFGDCTASSSSLTCGLNTGFYRTPQRGPSLIVGLQVCTAINLPMRDPITITFEGSNQPTSLLNLGASWTLLYSGSSGLDTDPGRLACGISQYFTSNLVWYSSYRFLVTSIRGSDSSTRYSEVQLIGY